MWMISRPCTGLLKTCPDWANNPFGKNRLRRGGCMFVLGNIIFAIARVLDTLLSLYFWIVIFAAILSWVRPDPYNPIVRTLGALTEPVLYRIRKHLPFTYISGLDFSPIVVLVVIQLIQSIVVRSLFQYAALL